MNKIKLKGIFLIVIGIFILINPFSQSALIFIIGSVFLLFSVANAAIKIKNKIMIQSEIIHFLIGIDLIIYRNLDNIYLKVIVIIYLILNILRPLLMILKHRDNNYNGIYKTTIFVNLMIMVVILIWPGLIGNLIRLSVGIVITLIGLLLLSIKSDFVIMQNIYASNSAFEELIKSRNHDNLNEKNVLNQNEDNIIDIEEE